jgi:hypothetical protein
MAVTFWIGMLPFFIVKLRWSSNIKQEECSTPGNSCRDQPVTFKKIHSKSPNMSEEIVRRRFLEAAGTAGIAALAGCGGNGGDKTPTSSGTSGGTGQGNPTGTDSSNDSDPKTDSNNDSNPNDDTSSQSFEINNGILTEMPSLQDTLGTIESYTEWNGDTDAYREADPNHTLEVNIAKGPNSGAIANDLSGSPEEYFVVKPARDVENAFGGDIYDQEINEVMDGTPIEFVDKGDYVITETPQLVKEGGHELIVGLTEQDGKTLAGKVHPSGGIIEPDEAKEWVENFLNDQYGTHADDVEEFMEGGSGSGNLAMDVGGALVYQNPRVQGVSIIPYVGENGRIDTDGDGYVDPERHLSSLDRQAGQ